MTDTTTDRPIRVSVDEKSGPYIKVPVELLEKVRAVLLENEIPHWVEHIAISVDGAPAETVINIRRGTDPRRVQDLLDAA
jgi:hypothetical protein